MGATAAAGAGHVADADEDLMRRLMHDTVDFAVTVTDADGIVRAWNAGATALTGYAASEIVGSSASRLYTAEDAAAGVLHQELAAAAAAGRSETEGWRVRKDGTRFWTHVAVTALRGDDGRLLGFGCIGHDLTARKQTEDSLRESEERFRLLVDSILDYAIFRLTPTGEVSSWNRGAERLKGYARDEIMGRHFEVFYDDEDRAAGRPAANLRGALANGRFEAEGWRIRKDGSRFWADVVITALYDAEGRHDGFVKVTRDLSERKRTEDALRDILEREQVTAARLRQLDELRSELVAVVAHDIRGPLAVVRGFADLLHGDWDAMSDDDRRDLVRRLADRTASLAGFVNDVFDTARIEAGQLVLDIHDVDLATTVARVRDDTAAAHPGRRLEVRLPDTGPVVRADEQRTWQILDNLVSNALKFSPVDEAVEIDVVTGDGEAVVAVRDHGPGIPPEHVPMLFQRFVRLPAAGGTPGSGMGLFIARSLTEAQGGRIWIDHEPDGGTTFRFTVPLA